MVEGEGAGDADDDVLALRDPDVLLDDDGVTVRDTDTLPDADPDPDTLTVPDTLGVTIGLQQKTEPTTPAPS